MKNFVNIFLISIAIILLLLPACNPNSQYDVQQDRIYAKYEVSYNASKDITNANVAFRLGGKDGNVVQLEGHSYVKFNNEYLIYRPVFAYYENSFDTLILESQFKYIDLDSNIFINNVVLHKIELPENIDTLRQGFDYELFFVGDSLLKNEIISAYIYSSLETDITSFSQSTESAKSIFMSADKTINLNPGINYIYLKRVYKNPVQRATSVGAEITSIFQTEAKKIYVKSE